MPFKVGFSETGYYGDWLLSQIYDGLDYRLVFVDYLSNLRALWILC